MRTTYTKHNTRNEKTAGPEEASPKKKEPISKGEDQGKESESDKHVHGSEGKDETAVLRGAPWCCFFGLKKFFDFLFLCSQVWFFIFM